MADCTIVTAYYEFPSKRPPSVYHEWMHNFLTTNNSPMVIFCEKEMSNKISHLRSWNPNTLIVEREFTQLYCNKWHDYWVRDLARDREKCHNEQLYIIWHEKTKFVEEAIKLDPFGTDYFSWCDMGYFRDKWKLPKYINFPRIPENMEKNKIHMIIIDQFSQSDINSVIGGNLENVFQAKVCTGGGCFLGHKDAWGRWVPTYYGMIENMMAVDTFTGKDQDVMSMIVILFPDLISARLSNGDWFLMADLFS